MNPLIGAGLISAGASLFGGAFANRENDRRVAEQNRLNYQMFKEQNAYNERMWHLNNAYNTPLEQRRRYEEAGINPFLALGNITPGVAQGVTSASPAPAMRADYRDPVGSAVSQGVDAYISSLTAKKIEAEKDLAQSKAEEQNILNEDLKDRKLEEKKLTIADRQYKEALTQFTEVQKVGFQSLTDAQVRELDSRIKLNASTEELNKLEKQLKTYELKNILPAQAQKLRAEAVSAYSYAKYCVKLGVLAEQQVQESMEKVLLMRAQKLNVNADTDQIRAMTKPLVENLKASAREKDAHSRYVDARRENIGFENGVAAAGVLNDYLNTFIRAGSAIATFGFSDIGTSYTSGGSGAQPNAFSMPTFNNPTNTRLNYRSVRR